LPTRSVELYQIFGKTHHDGIIMAYLRKEKLLIEADVFTPLPPGAEPPKVPNAQAVNLEANVRRLNIEVDRIVSIHGRVVPMPNCWRPSAKNRPRQRRSKFTFQRQSRLSSERCIDRACCSEVTRV